jgi:hypothetical protein
LATGLLAALVLLPTTGCFFVGVAGLTYGGVKLAQHVEHDQAERRAQHAELLAKQDDDQPMSWPTMDD